ncbi:UDP-glucuronosyltransferase 2B15-like [Drosophila innubila]|uniref:UDP-glucuronosyltransferase 2B15-like n=1 Tax=Drosophila innubila TaxID=198719 RepID=UPI00148E6888|nr:UDP-glucuronosyltransferase 2B15-like [Drosophila innubila]
MLNRKYLGIAIALQLLGWAMAGNILALMGMTSHSHHIWNSVLLYELAERGHNLTILSVNLPRPNDKVPANVTYIYLERAYDFYTDDKDKIDINFFIGISSYATIPLMYKFGVKTAEYITVSKGLQQLLDYPDEFKFDVIINDCTMGPYLMGFVHKFRYPPVIGMTALSNNPVSIDFMSNSYFPALIPYFSTLYKPKMNFFERFDNTLIFALDTLYRRLYYNPKLDKIMRPFFAPDMPPLSELAKLTKIALINTHPAINFVESLPPNMIEIGGLQGRPGNPLPTDLDQFMRKGKRGAIFFSMGTNMLPHDVDRETKLKIVEAFRQLSDYNIIWKFDKEYLKDVQMPGNVLVRDFLPQRDILAHESLILFVSHCGGLSTQEATWHGVPLVGIPLFLDQHRNLLQTLSAGAAVKVDYLKMTTEILVSAIKEVAENKSYSVAMKLRSKRLRDTPVPPLELAVWWVEYLMRHPDPVHLHSTAKELNYFQAHSLDVLAVLALIPLIILYGLSRLCAGKGKQQLKKHHKRD